MPVWVSVIGWTIYAIAVLSLIGGAIESYIRNRRKEWANFIVPSILLFMAFGLVYVAVF